MNKVSNTNNWLIDIYLKLFLTKQQLYESSCECGELKGEKEEEGKYEKRETGVPGKFWNLWFEVWAVLVGLYGGRKLPESKIYDSIN